MSEGITYADAGGVRIWLSVFISRQNSLLLGSREQKLFQFVHLDSNILNGDSQPESLLKAVGTYDSCCLGFFQKFSVNFRS